MSVLHSEDASVFAVLVVVVTAITYIVSAILRRDGGGARLWAISYLLMLISMVSYVVWLASAHASWGTDGAAAIANAATVGAVGTLLLGCRAFNGEAVVGPAFMVAALALLTGAATLAESGTQREWAGAMWLFFSLTGLYVGTVIHALSGRMRTLRTSWAFAAAAGVQGVFTVVRGVLFVLYGPDAGLFSDWFSATPGAVVTVTAGLVMSFCIFMLRSELTAAPRVDGPGTAAEIMSTSRFQTELSAVLRRASERTEVVAVIAVRVEDVPAISVAFGSEIVQGMTRSLRASVRRFASPLALVAEGNEATSMYVATLSASPADARRQAALIYRGVVQAFVAEGSLVVPGIGVGVASSQTIGYSATALCAAALAASAEAAESDETSVVFALARDFASDRTTTEPA